MKNGIAALLISAGLLLAVSGCAANQPEEQIPVSGKSDKRESVVYYEQADGYLVPVSVETDWGDDMLEGLLGYMVAGEQTNHALEESGLSAMLPADTVIAADFQDGTAMVDIQSGRLADMSEKRSENIVAAVVSTACQFDSVDAVQIRLNGEANKLGTVDISEPFENIDVNPAYAQDEGFSPVKVYYKTVDTGLMVPVTKYAPNPDASTVVRAMMKKHSDSELMTLLPEGVELISVETDSDGVVTVNFSKEILELNKSSEKEEKFFKGLRSALMNLEGVTDVVVLADGELYDCQVDTETVFGNKIVNYENFSEEQNS